MNQSPRVSIIIPAYNAEGTIIKCLTALVRQTTPLNLYEIIVVDDGSDDSTCAQVAKIKNVRLFKQHNAGPSAARNLGINQAFGEIVLFTDDDCEPVEDWIERMLVPFQREEIIGVKGTYLTRQQELVPRFVQLEFEDKYDRMVQDEYIDFIDTYSAGYRRNILIANNGFDTTFPVASTEDQELSFRLARQGFKMVFEPRAKVYHLHHPRDIGEYWRKKFNIGYWKVVVHLRHPNKLLRDSHTPQILKLQILLIGICGMGLLSGIIWQPLWWVSGFSGLIFFLTTLPFVVKAWSKDLPAAIISPALLFIRALALGTGFAAGLLFNMRTKEH
ncbi:MAG TPA: glycosyltransferase [Anaerolineales bacterium]|nr:glycosyltransferase [Anaerolineales bacterium]